MELNHLNYRKAMNKISIPEDVDDKVIKMFEELDFNMTNGSSVENRKIIRKSGKVLLIAATIVVLSCGSIFAFNRIIINSTVGSTHTSNIIKSTEIFYDGGAKVVDGCEYNGAWEIAYGDKVAIISHIKITDLQVFFDGTIWDYIADDAASYVSQSLYLIYEDGTKLDAGFKFHGTNYKIDTNVTNGSNIANGANGAFNRDYLLENQIDVNRVVAIEFSGNLIKLK